MDTMKHFLNIIKESLIKCSPEKLTESLFSFQKNEVSILNNKINFDDFGNVYVFGSGKASQKMAIPLEKSIGNFIKDGLIISNSNCNLNKIKVIYGAHPIPDKLTFNASNSMYEKILSLSSNDFFIFLLSGGTSSMFEIPEIGVSEIELSNLYNLLLKSGMDIKETNIIRKCFSSIKGGKLGNKMKAKGIILVLSDVLGDDFGTIGSGPFYPSEISFKRAKDILKKYNIVLKHNLTSFLEKEDYKTYPDFKHLTVGSNEVLIDAIERQLTSEKEAVHKYYNYLKGEAKDLGKTIYKFLIEEEKRIDKDTYYIFGGETTVTVKGNGKGGRNQELALSVLKYIQNNPNISLVTFGSDGIDGFTDAAGAYISGSVYEKSIELSLNIHSYLENNDSYTFFKKTDSLIKLGKTGNNILDICLVKVKKS